MENVLQVAFLVIVSLLGGGLASLVIVGVSMLASSRRNS
jgi:hypothetical protein